MAAPHIAGIVAQLFQADPTATPAEIEAALKGTAYRFTDGAAVHLGRRLHDVVRQGRRPGRRRRGGRAAARRRPSRRPHGWGEARGGTGAARARAVPAGRLAGSTWNTCRRREILHAPGPRRGRRAGGLDRSACAACAERSPSTGRRPTRPPSPGWSSALVPRGPDGQGSWSNGRVAFGHRRLSVIDLSTRGSQPMVDNELGLTAVFNGCIYDYQELRAELEGHGYRFFSTSDTEVILKGYAPLGHRRRLAPARDVRLRHRRAGHRPGGHGPRPARHQAALPRRDAGQRLRFASTLPGAAPGGRRRHLDRPGRAAPLPDLARRRPGAADDPERRPEAAAGHRAGRSRPTAPSTEHRYWDAALRAPPRARELVGPRLGGRRSRRRCGSPSAGAWSPTSRSACCSPAAWTPA